MISRMNIQNIERVISRMIAFLIFCTGIGNIASVLFPILPSKLFLLDRFLDTLSSYTLIIASRYIILLSGFFFMILGLQLLQRKVLAWYVTVILLIVSLMTHILKDHTWNISTLLFILFTSAPLIFLLMTKSLYIVKHDRPTLRKALVGFGLSLVVGLGYGVLGFYIMEKHHFGQTFTFTQSVTQIARMYFTYEANPLQPRTRFAQWFIESVYVFGVTSAVTAFYFLLQPVVLRTITTEEHRGYARALLRKYANTPQDFFKLWKDKSLFFCKKSFFAYRVARGTAIVLGDPVGEQSSLQECLVSFQYKCRRNGWIPVFIQTLPNHLPLYSSLGYKHVKIADEAFVDLLSFSLEGSEQKDIRNACNKLQKLGYTAEYRKAPHQDIFVQTLKSVSDEWLSFAGRREHTFTTGQFEKEYVRYSDVVVVRDAEHQIIAFVTIIPSVNPIVDQHTRAIDLMRRRASSPNGTMEFLITSLILELQKQHVNQLSLGLSPLAHVNELEQPLHIKKSLEFLYTRMNKLFSFQGLYTFKQRFHPRWEARYVVYPNDRILPKFLMALLQITKV